MWGLSGNSVLEYATQGFCLSMDNCPVHFLSCPCCCSSVNSMAVRLLQRTRVSCLSSCDGHSPSLIFWFHLLTKTDDFSSFSLAQNQGLNRQNGLMSNPANLFNLFLHTGQHPVYRGFVHLSSVKRLGEKSIICFIVWLKMYHYWTNYVWSKMGIFFPNSILAVQKNKWYLLLPKTFQDICCLSCFVILLQCFWSHCVLIGLHHTQGYDLRL